MIYLDNAATTLHKPEAVKRAVWDAMETMGSSGRGAYPAALEASRMIYETRELAAEFFGAPSPVSVAFTSNATEALNIAVSGLIRSKDHVICTQMEHNSVLRPLYRKEKEGAQLSILPCGDQGIPDMSKLPELFRKNTRAVICTHASNVTGDLNDIRTAAELCRENGVLFILDTAQTAGSIPIHMGEMKIDVLCFTGHKGLMGPQGTGGICLGEGIRIPAFKTGGSGVHSFDREQPGQGALVLEAGTLNGHGIAGLHEAFSFLKQTTVEAVREKEQELCSYFCREAARIPGVRLYGNTETKERAAVAALNIRDYDSAAVCDELAQYYGIAVRGGIHCAPLMHRFLGTEKQGAVRFSFSWYNEMEEAEQAVLALREIAG